MRRTTTTDYVLTLFEARRYAIQRESKLPRDEEREMAIAIRQGIAQSKLFRDQGQSKATKRILNLEARVAARRRADFDRLNDLNSQLDNLDGMDYSYLKTHFHATTALRNQVLADIEILDVELTEQEIIKLLLNKFESCGIELTRQHYTECEGAARDYISNSA
jgi:hypothetical protein